MNDSKESLEGLEKLLGEFFDPETSNDRKHEIEKLLATFSCQSGAWRQCMYFMMLSSDQYVAMYCLATIESVITKQWQILMWEERTELTSLLYKHTLEYHSRVPNFIRNKLIKLVVDIARYDWPHFYPDFFSNIMTLIKVPETTLLGLAFLQTASEELICPREDLNISRKEDLKRLFTAHIPHVYSVLIDVLHTDRPTLNTAVHEAALQALCHVFSWLPLQAVNNVTLLSLVCHYSTKQDEVGVNALAAINELLFKNCVPPSFLPSLMTLCCHGYNLLQAAVQEDLSQMSDNYLLKLTHFSHLCVTKHWPRIEQNHEFPHLDFLSVFFQFTFQQPELEHFYECLEVWAGFLEYLQMKDAPIISRYEDVILLLVQEILKKVHSEKALDDDKCDDNGETERQTFLRHCIEVISKGADIIPNPVCSVVVNSWRELCTVYTQLLSMTADMPQCSSEMSESLLYCAAVTQTVGRLHAHLQTVPHISAALATLAYTATKTKLHNKIQDPKFAHVLINLHAQVLSALQMWLDDEHLNSAMESALPLLDNNPVQPVRLQHSAAHLLSAITAVRRPASVFHQLHPLFGMSLSHLQQEARTVIQCALCRCILMWNMGLDNEAQSMELLCCLIRSMLPSGVQDLKQLTELLLHCKPENRNAKKMLYSVLQPVLEQVVIAFPQHVSNSVQVSDQMLTFFLEAFRSLQDLVGAQMTQHAVETFIKAYTGVNLKDCEAGVDKLLQLLVLIVEQSAPVFKQFVPSCITLCLDHIYPELNSLSAPNIVSNVFHLLSSILLHKWQYFYHGTLFDCQPAVEHSEQLIAILQAFGHSLTQPDVTLFAQNLDSLEMLNQKWKLYHKELFRDQFLGLYLTVLLNTLINKSHALLAEDIAAAIFNMASVDFHTFYYSFIPVFLSQLDGLDSCQREFLQRNMQLEKDLPSFVQNVHRLTNDVRCYRLCNASQDGKL